MEILSEKIYEDVKTFVNVTNQNIFIGLRHTGSGSGCSNIGCGNQPDLKWQTSGESFVFQPWLTGGIYYDTASKQCAEVRVGV